MTSFVLGVISLPTHFGTSCIHGIRNSVNWCRMLFITYSCQITRELENTICIKFDPLLIWVVWWQPHHGVDDPFWVIYDINSEPDLFLGHFHQIARSKTKTTTKNGIILWENGNPLLICSLPSTSQTILRIFALLYPLGLSTWTNGTPRNAPFFPFRFRLNPMSSLLGYVMLTPFCLPKWTPFKDRQRHGKHLSKSLGNSVCQLF